MVNKRVYGLVGAVYDRQLLLFVEIDAGTASTLDTLLKRDASIVVLLTATTADLVVIGS